MLEETKQLLERNKKSLILRQHRNNRIKYYFNVVLKYFKYIVIISSIVMFVFFPKQTAYWLGTWYKNFTHTFINTINE